MYPDLNRLRVFYHVYAQNSVIRAAEKLHLSQPAVSQQIKKLEQEIKAPLFVRLHKKLVPTNAGHKLYKTVEPFLKNLAIEIENISTPMDRPYGKINIGAPIVFGTAYLPKICHAFRVLYPDVSFSIKFEESDLLVDMLLKGELDLALIDYFSPLDQLPGAPEIYQIEPLMRENFILACSSDYYQTKVKGDISINNLISLDYLTDENEPIILRHWFFFYFKKNIPDLKFVMAIEAHQALMACMSQGMGLGITSYHLFAKEIEQQQIIPIFPNPKKLISTISMVYLKNSVPTVTQNTFCDFLKAEFEPKTITAKFNI